MPKRKADADVDWLAAGLEELPPIKRVKPAEAWVELKNDYCYKSREVLMALVADCKDSRLIHNSLNAACLNFLSEVLAVLSGKPSGVSSPLHLGAAKSWATYLQEPTVAAMTMMDFAEIRSVMRLLLNAPSLANNRAMRDFKNRRAFYVKYGKDSEKYIQDKYKHKATRKFLSQGSKSRLLQDGIALVDLCQMSWLRDKVIPNCDPLLALVIRLSLPVAHGWESIPYGACSLTLGSLGSEWKKLLEAKEIPFGNVLPIDTTSGLSEIERFLSSMPTSTPGTLLLTFLKLAFAAGSIGALLDKLISDVDDLGAILLLDLVCAALVFRTTADADVEPAELITHAEPCEMVAQRYLVGWNHVSITPAIARRILEHRS